LVREVNYRYIEGRYVCMDEGDVIKTTYRVLRLDDGLAVTDSWPLDDALLRVEPPRFPVHGVEDLRLFRRRDSWWASGTIRQHRTDGRCQIMLLRLEALDEGTPRVVEARLLPSMSPRRHEKNWMPIEGETMTWMWNADPTVILRLDDVTGTLVPNRPARGEVRLRGGSQVIRWRDGWLAVCARRASARYEARTHERVPPPVRALGRFTRRAMGLGAVSTGRRRVGSGILRRIGHRVA